MKRMEREHVLALQVADAAAEMMLCLLVGCASSPGSPVARDASPDRGNSESGWNCATPDGGKSTCTPICGDGVLAGGEVCDDDNTAAGDGCSPDCQVETGWECHGGPSVCTALPARVRTTPSLGAPITG